MTRSVCMEMPVLTSFADSQNCPNEFSAVLVGEPSTGI